MPLHALRPAVRAAAPALVTLTLGLGTLAPAMGTDTVPPVAVDDSITIEARTTEFGGVSFIDVLANDTAADGEVLEICRVQAPERGLSVAEVDPNGNFSIQTPHAGLSAGGLGDVAEGAHERLVVLPWANRAGTYQFTYWACDTTRLEPATVTVTVTETPDVTVRKVDQPGRLRVTNPRSSHAVVFYGGPHERRPDGRIRVAPHSHATLRVERRVIRWVAFSPRSGEVLGKGVVRGIRLPASSSRRSDAIQGSKPQLTPKMLRAWRDD